MDFDIRVVAYNFFKCTELIGVCQYKQGSI